MIDWRRWRWFDRIFSGPCISGRICCRADRKGQLVFSYRVVLLSLTLVAQLPMNLVLLKNISIVGVHWGAYMSMSSITCRHNSTNSSGTNRK